VTPASEERKRSVRGTDISASRELLTEQPKDLRQARAGGVPCYLDFLAMPSIQDLLGLPDLTDFE
jgi:hypothetical protein